MQSRITVFVPDEATYPIPFEFLDLVRKTYTNLDSDQEVTIRDFWTCENLNKELSAEWTGQTHFELLPPTPPE
eukprot:12404909-Karenia_brevis.AAC.1